LSVDLDALFFLPIPLRVLDPPAGLGLIGPALGEDALAEVLQEIVRVSGKEIGAILSKGRGRIGSRLRAEAVYGAREVGGIRLTEAAKYVGRDLSTVSLAVKRLEKQIQGDPKLRKRLEEISARLRRGRSPQYQRTKA
jgi:hypothetical protein